MSETCNKEEQPVVEQRVEPGRHGRIAKCLLLTSLVVTMTYSVGNLAQAQSINASQPPSDPYACGDGIVMQAVAALGYKGDADFWSGEKTACRLRPGNPKEAIVALTYTHGDQLSGNATDNDDAGFDLDLVIVRTDSGSLIARSAKGAHVDSDAITFETIVIDTANYMLAPGQRAFGVRVTHDSHCYHCNYGQTDLMLYLQHGKRLDPIFDAMINETRGEWGTTDCDDLPTETTRTIKVASSASHGLSDLLLTTMSTPTPDDDIPAACKDAPAHVDTVKLRFDGKTFPLPVAMDAY